MIQLQFLGLHAFSGLIFMYMLQKAILIRTSITPAHNNVQYQWH